MDITSHELHAQLPSLGIHIISGAIDLVDSDKIIFTSNGKFHVLVPIEGRRRTRKGLLSQMVNA